MNDKPDGSGPYNQPPHAGTPAGGNSSGGSAGGSSSWKPAPPSPPPGYGPVYAAPAPPPRGGGAITRVLTGLFASLLLISIILNFYLGLYFISSMSGPQEVVYHKGDATQRIAVIPVSGMIDDSTAVAVRQTLQALRDNPPKAVILRVDSGGGGVSASDRIWHELQLFKKELNIPIVASFGSVAASGGYYISADSDYIVIEPTGLTGSIGVIAQAFTVQGLLDKVGVTPEIIASSKANKKDNLSPFRAWDEEDRSELRVILDAAHERFVKIVSDGRSKVLTPEQVAVLATGAPYTAQEALDNKLVDALGYMDSAIAKAKELAKLDPSSNPSVVVVSPAKKFSILGLLGMSSQTPSAASLFDSQEVRKLVGELSQPRVEYTMRLR